MEASDLGTSSQVDARSGTARRLPLLGPGPGHPHRPPLLTFTAFALAVALLVGSVYAWQHGRVAGAETSLATTRGQLTTSRAQAERLRSEIANMREQAVGIRDELASARQQLHSSSSRAEVLANRIGDLKDRLAETQTSLLSVRGEAAAARQELARLAGPRLPDGTYRVRVLAAQAAISPPRMLVSQPFVEGAWRVLSVVPDVRVSIVRPASGDRATLPLGTFGKILRRSVVQQADVKTSPYAIVVHGGRVERIVEKPLTPP
jgi:hypothetical protein